MPDPVLIDEINVPLFLPDGATPAVTAAARASCCVLHDAFRHPSSLFRRTLPGP